jgi:hypothetical protein
MSIKRTLAPTAPLLPEVASPVMTQSVKRKVFCAAPAKGVQVSFIAQNETEVPF